MITKRKNKDRMIAARKAVQDKKTKYSSMPFAYKIKYWADKYRSTPNGWAVASMIQSQYRSEVAKISPSARKKRKL